MDTACPFHVGGLKYVFVYVQLAGSVESTFTVRSNAKYVSCLLCQYIGGDVLYLLSFPHSSKAWIVHHQTSRLRGT